MIGDDDSPRSVVIPAVSAPSTIACLRSLGLEGIHTIVISEDPFAPAFSSDYCDEAVTVPDPESDLDGYARALLVLARRKDVRTIVPVREEDAFVLSKYRDAFSEHVATPWPTLEQLRSVHDRVQLASHAAKAGVACPRTRPLDEVTSFDAPAIIKSRYNLLVTDYVGTLPPDRAAEHKDILYLEAGEEPDATAVRDAFGHVPIVQEFIPGGDEYMVGALCDRGEVLATVQHRQIRGTSYANGGGVYRQCIQNPALEADARVLLEELDWHGLACIEYVCHPETNEFALVEVNPRMWLSVAANVRMGVNFPLYYWMLACENADRIDPAPEIGASCHYLLGELCYLASLLTDYSSLVDRPSIAKAVFEVASTCLRDRTFDVLDRDDPWPFVFDFIKPMDARLPESVPISEFFGRVGGSTEPITWQNAAKRLDTPGSGDVPMRTWPSEDQLAPPSE